MLVLNNANAVIAEKASFGQKSGGGGGGEGGGGEE